MFMVREEYINTKKLLKVKIKTAGKSFKLFFVVAAILFLCNLIPTLRSILQTNNYDVMPYHIQDYSLFFFIVLVIAYLIIMLQYRQTNNYLSVLPQTSNSRFISSQLFNYILAIVVGFTALIMYLINYGIFKLFSHYKDNIYFALSFDIGFLITGFFTFLIYSFLVIAILGLTGTILRKWKYYGTITFIVILSLMIINLQSGGENVLEVFAFLVKEPTPIWFMIKGIVLWFIITLISLIINYYTVYYKSQKEITATHIAIIIAIMVLFTMIIPAILFTFNTNSGNAGNVAENVIQAPSENEYFAGFTEIRIDVSHLPKNSKLNIEGENVFFPEFNNNNIYKESPHFLTAYNTEVLNSLQGDTIIMYYLLPERSVNGHELYQYSNPKLTTYLEGDTLHIDYTFENAYVIFLPVWGIVRQFDCYRNKEVLQKTPLGYSSAGSRHGSITINVE